MKEKLMQAGFQLAKMLFAYQNYMIERERQNHYIHMKVSKINFCSRNELQGCQHQLHILWSHILLSC